MFDICMRCSQRVENHQARNTASNGLVSHYDQGACIAALKEALRSSAETTADNGAWPNTMDAERWAKAFCDRNQTADEGYMIAWFNAIMKGYDTANQSKSKAHEAMRLLEVLVNCIQADATVYLTDRDGTHGEQWFINQVLGLVDGPRWRTIEALLKSVDNANT